MNRLISFALTLVALSGLAMAQADDFDIDPKGSEEAPAEVSAGDTITIRNNSNTGWLVVQMKLVLASGEKVPVGDPIVIPAGGAPTEIVVPNDPALHGLTFEFDPELWTPDGAGGFNLDPMNGL